MVVVVPHRRLRLGPTELPSQLESFLAGAHRLSLDELGQQPGIDPLVGLLTLPVRPEAEIQTATDQILRPRSDLLDTVLSILGVRFPYFTREEIMALINWAPASAASPAGVLACDRPQGALQQQRRQLGLEFGKAGVAAVQLMQRPPPPPPTRWA